MTTAAKTAQHGQRAESVAAARTIVWLIAGDEKYGLRRATLGLTAALSQRGWACPFIALREGSFSAELERQGCVVRSLGMPEFPHIGASPIGRLRGLLRLASYRRRALPLVADALRDFNADVLHVRWPTFIGFAGPAAKRAGAACIWQMPNAVGGGYAFDLNRRLYQRACKKYDVTPLANSAFTAATLGDKPVKPIVFHLAVDPALFDPERADLLSRAELGIPDDAVVFGIFAWMGPMKGQLRFLKAMLQSQQADAPPLHLLLLGGPENEYFKQIRAAAEETGAGDRVHLLGRVDDPDRYYGVLDVGVNSRIDPEPFGFSVIEAMMMARPVLAHALGGPAETIIDGKTGWHVPDPTVESFQRGIERALADRDRWPEMRAAARAHALEHFSTPAQARRYIDIVEPIIRRRER